MGKRGKPIKKRARRIDRKRGKPSWSRKNMRLILKKHPLARRIWGWRKCKWTLTNSNYE